MENKPRWESKLGAISFMAGSLARDLNNLLMLPELREIRNEVIQGARTAPGFAGDFDTSAQLATRL